MSPFTASNVTCPTCSAAPNRPCRGKRMTSVEPFHTARKSEAARRNRPTAGPVNPLTGTVLP